MFLDFKWLDFRSLLNLTFSLTRFRQKTLLEEKYLDLGSGHQNKSTESVKNESFEITHPYFHQALPFLALSFRLSDQLEISEAFNDTL